MHVSQLPKTYLPELFAYIKGRDTLYRDFINLPALEQRGRVLLRHDVDDLLERSVAMAELQHKCGVCATYFILDTAPYWQPDNPDMWLKIERIQSLGHEIAWHNNVLSRWVQTKRPIDDLIEEPLLHFLQHGFQILGSASHGDRLCYEYGFVNYEVFTECKRSTEAKDFKEPVIEIPKVSMKDFGLLYEAYHLPRQQYFSESGGNWKELPQVQHFEDTEKITHILIHPQWWAL